MAPGLLGRCSRCYLRERYCACAKIAPVQTTTRFLVVRHKRESYKSTNSARWAGLALSNFELYDYENRAAFEPAVLARPNAWLLFPRDEGDVELALPPSAAPSTLVVLDGTWRQVRRMLNHLKELKGLPRLALKLTRPAVPRLRQRDLPGQLSTMEAIALAVEALEGEARALPLWSAYAALIEGSQRGRGTHRETDARAGSGGIDE